MLSFSNWLFRLLFWLFIFYPVGVHRTYVHPVLLYCYKHTSTCVCNSSVFQSGRWTGTAVRPGPGPGRSRAQSLMTTLQRAFPALCKHFFRK